MNTQLMDAIVKHIFSSLAVIPSNFINLGASKSLMNKEFLLAEKIPFILDDDSQSENKVWGTQLSAGQQEIKMLLADCSTASSLKEYALVVQLKDSPIYGIYLVCDDSNSESLIACSLNGKEWIECLTYLQATFLAGMEQVKETGLSWNKCVNYQNQLEALISFIQFHHSVYENKYEG